MVDTAPTLIYRKTALLCSSLNASDSQSKDGSLKEGKAEKKSFGGADVYGWQWQFERLVCSFES